MQREIWREIERYMRDMERYAESYGEKSMLILYIYISMMGFVNTLMHANKHIYN